MFRILYMCVKGLFVASVRSSRACLTTGPLIVLLGFNYLLYRQSTAPRFCLRCIHASSTCFVTTSGASGRVLRWLQVLSCSVCARTLHTLPAGNRAAQRAQKYMTWKLVEDLDEESLQKILGTLPAWIKV